MQHAADQEDDAQKHVRDVEELIVAASECAKGKDEHQGQCDIALFLSVSQEEVCRLTRTAMAP
jgi:hypothetical protein